LFGKVRPIPLHFLDQREFFVCVLATEGSQIGMEQKRQFIAVADGVHLKKEKTFVDNCIYMLTFVFMCGQLQQKKGRSEMKVGVNDSRVYRTRSKYPRRFVLTQMGDVGNQNELPNDNTWSKW
jgi:hypothetical protein